MRDDDYYEEDQRLEEVQRGWSSGKRVLVVFFPALLQRIVRPVVEFYLDLYRFDSRRSKRVKSLSRDDRKAVRGRSGRKARV